MVIVKRKEDTVFYDKCNAKVFKAKNSKIKNIDTGAFIDEKGFKSNRFVFKNGIVEKKVISKLEIVVATTCNLGCSYCYANQGKYIYNHEIISFEMIDSIISFIIDNNIKDVNSVQFFGGEPLLATKEIIYFCEKLEMIGIHPVYRMVTNFTIVSPLFLSAAKKYDFKITVSLDGPKKINDSQRFFYGKKESCFDLVVSNIVSAKKHGVTIRAIEATYTEAHKKEGLSYSETAKYLCDLTGIDFVFVASVEEKGKCENKSAFYSHKIGEIDRSLLLNNLTRRGTCGVCQAGFTTICIFPNGDIFPCHRHLGDNVNIGNILNMNDKLSLELIRVQDVIRERVICEKCMSCNWSEVCNVCTALVMDNYDERYCESVNDEYLRLLNTL